MAVWEALAAGPLFVDELGSRTGLGPAELSRVLFQMELARAARKLPGNRVERR